MKKLIVETKKGKILESVSVFRAVSGDLIYEYEDGSISIITAKAPKGLIIKGQDTDTIIKKS